jgi:hypothetical protein
MKAVITFAATAALILGLTPVVWPAFAGNLDHCPPLPFGPDATPHCVQQVDFCVDSAMTPYYLVVEAKRFDDPRDLIADISLSGRVFGDAATMLSALGAERAHEIAMNVIAWSKAHQTWKGNIITQVRDDCIAGTLDFLDNHGLR